MVSFDVGVGLEGKENPLVEVFCGSELSFICESDAVSAAAVVVVVVVEERKLNPKEPPIGDMIMNGTTFTTITFGYK